MIHSRIIIIGSGPAGLACAIQLKRMGLEPLIIEKKQPGGMLYNANLIENYPGFPNGIRGDKLVALLMKQASRFQLNIVRDTIYNVGYIDGIFNLTGISGIYCCDVLVLASGTSPDIPEIFPGDLFLKGLIHADISALRNIKGKTIGIVGAGDAAFDYSLTLSENDNNVFIFNRGNRVKALKALREKVFINNKIKYLEDIVVEKLEMLQGYGLQAICHSASSHQKYSLDYLIFATGRHPALEMIGTELREQLGKLQEDQRLFFAGDVKNEIFRQLSIAVGDGVRTAMEIFHHESDQQNRK
jgi:thioredoxin reductase